MGVFALVALLLNLIAVVPLLPYRNCDAKTLICAPSGYSRATMPSEMWL